MDATIEEEGTKEDVRSKEVIDKENSKSEMPGTESPNADSALQSGDGSEHEFDMTGKSE